MEAHQSLYELLALPPSTCVIFIFLLPCSFNWDTRLDKHSTRYLITKCLNINAKYLWIHQVRLSSALFTHWTEVISNLSQVSSDQDRYHKAVPLNASTITSVAGWLVPIANGDIAVSIISHPASTAFKYVIEATPDV